MKSGKNVRLRQNNKNRWIFAYFLPICYHRPMKTILFLILSFLISFLSLSLPWNLYADWSCAWNWWASCADPGEISYCKDGSCSIEKWSDAVKTATNGLLSDKSLTAFITDTVLYFLWFVTLIGVLYVIYAGFQIMTGGGDEEKIKKARQIIIYVLIGIVVMWLAYSIVMLILDAVK